MQKGRFLVRQAVESLDMSKHALVDACNTEELPEKNTFIDYPPAPMAEIREVPLRSAPAAYFQRLLRRSSNPEETESIKNNESDFGQSECSSLSSAETSECMNCGSTCLHDSIFCRKCGKSRFADGPNKCNSFSDAGSSTDCPIETPPPEDVLEDPSLLSIGSAAHNLGTCNPCAFYWKPVGCQNGQSCLRCHLCPKDELKARKKTKEKQRRAQSQIATTDAIAASLCAIARENPEIIVDDVDQHRKEPAYVPCVMQKNTEASQSLDASSQSQDDDSSDDTFTSRWESRSKRTESPAKIVIKNTFIQISKPPLDPPSEPPTRSAPGALLLQRFRLKHDPGEAPSSDTLQSGTKETTESSPPVNCATTPRQATEDLPKTDHPEGESREEVPMGCFEAHVLGQCSPCAYFLYKTDGCRQGTLCNFCHLCDKGEIKRRKRERIQHLKESGEFIPRFAQRREAFGIGRR